MTPSRKWEVGFLKQVPLPDFDQRTVDRVESLAKSGVRVTLSSDLWDETSSHFVGLTFPPFESLEEWTRALRRKAAAPQLGGRGHL